MGNPKRHFAADCAAPLRVICLALLALGWLGLNGSGALSQRDNKSAKLAQLHDKQIAAITAEGQFLYLNPIAILRNGKLINPVLYKSSQPDPVVDRFMQKLYPRGAVFELWQAGQSKGNLLLGQYENGCGYRFNFEGNSGNEMDFDRNAGALALSGEATSGHANFQRPASAAELADFARLSQQFLAQTNPNITAEASRKVHSVLATRIGTSGNPLLAGSISFTVDKVEYWFFAIFEHVGRDWQTAVTQLHTVKDLDTRKDAQEESFFDQMDVDGDGIDEIFTRTRYSEGSSFTAYGLREGKWLRIYQSSIGGC